MAEYGIETAEKICAGLLQERPVTVRLKEHMNIEEKEQLITELQDYKKSLIFEVVSGKRKVV